MKPIEWSKEKNDWLMRERGVSFEEVADKVAAADVITVIDHPNRTNYPNQQIENLRPKRNSISTIWCFSTTRSENSTNPSSAANGSPCAIGRRSSSDTRHMRATRSQKTRASPSV